MKDYKWLTAALVLYFIIAGSAYWAAQMEVKHRAEMFNDQRVQIAEGEREAAQELAKQYKAEYQAAVFEIAGLKADNEELRSVLDEWNEVAAQVIAAKTKAWMPAGQFRIVHYCSCYECTGKHPEDEGYGITATGTTATEGRTVAVDPDIIPLGSEVLINGVIYIAEDTGVEGKMIDIYIEDHAQATAMGTYLTSVSWR